MQRAHKIQLTPNQEAVEHFNQACGTARFVYNKALAEWKEQYLEGGKPNGTKLKRYFNSFKNDDYPWIQDVTKCAAEQPFTNLQRAFTNFFEGRSKYPKFKRKFKRDSFYLSNDQFSVSGKYIRIPKLGYVKMTENLRFKGRILGATVSRRANKWFVSIQVELDQPIVLTDLQKPSVGIDFGIKTFAYLSDGTVIENPRTTKRFEGQLRRLNKSLSRKIKGSSNWKKAKQAIQVLHKKIADARLDFVHKFTHFIATNYGIVCIEDLNVAGMVRNHKLAKHIQDLSLGETRRQLEYKCNEVRYCDRFAPSSKTCCKCDWVKTDLTLSDREFVCSNCGHTEDRDSNASKNIVRWATPKPKPVERKALVSRVKRKTNLSVMKQE